MRELRLRLRARSVRIGAHSGKVNPARPAASPSTLPFTDFELSACTDSADRTCHGLLAAELLHALSKAPASVVQRSTPAADKRAEACAVKPKIPCASSVAMTSSLFRLSRLSRQVLVLDPDAGGGCHAPPH